MPTDTLWRYDLPNGHKLYTTSTYKRGYYAAPFGGRLCHIIDRGETFVFDVFGGLVDRKEALEWMQDAD